MQRKISSDVNQVLKPVGQARGLPNQHYTSAEMFEQEKHSVLFANWSGIGFGKDIPEPGDAKPVNFLGMPLLMVRDEAGNIGVFQNTCRHRGMILVEEPTRIRGAIRCPYHSWCYSLKGALRTTPHVGGQGVNQHADVDHAELGLFAVRSHVWRDVVFVNVSGQAPAFEDYAAPLIERWQEFDQPIYHGGESSSIEFDLRTNWKLAVENYCESYHLPWVHPALNSYSRLEDHYNIEQPGTFAGQGTRVYQQLKNEDGATFADFANLRSKWDAGAEYIALFPNVLFGVHRDHAFAIVLEPVNFDRTREYVELYYAREDSAETETGGLRSVNAQRWKTVFAEDVFVVEGMQRGRHGTLFDGGKFSPVMDNATHTFHYWVATQVENSHSQINESSG